MTVINAQAGPRGLGPTMFPVFPTYVWIIVDVSASLPSGVWESLNPGPDFHDIQMVTYALQFNPDLVLDESPHIDAMLAKYDPGENSRGLWKYIRRLIPSIDA